MHTYMTVMFWFWLVITVLRFFILAFKDKWPMEQKITLGMHISQLIAGIGLTIWAGILLFSK
jgi:hypothetical protein